MGSFTITGPIFTNLIAGDSEEFTITSVADQLGMFTHDVYFFLSDEDLPGATRERLKLSISYEVVGP